MDCSYNDEVDGRSMQELPPIEWGRTVDIVDVVLVSEVTQNKVQHTCIYIHRVKCTCTHVHCMYMYIHDRATYTYMYMYIYRSSYIHLYMYVQYVGSC